MRMGVYENGRKVRPPRAGASLPNEGSAEGGQQSDETKQGCVRGSGRASWSPAANAAASGGGGVGGGGTTVGRERDDRRNARPPVVARSNARIRRGSASFSNPPRSCDAVGGGIPPRTIPDERRRGIPRGWTTADPGTRGLQVHPGRDVMPRGWHKDRSGQWAGVEGGGKMDRRLHFDPSGIIRGG